MEMEGEAASIMREGSGGDADKEMTSKEGPVKDPLAADGGDLGEDKTGPEGGGNKEGVEGVDGFNAVIKVSPSDVEMSSDEGEGDDDDNQFGGFDDSDGDRTVHFDRLGVDNDDDSSSEEEKYGRGKRRTRKDVFFGDGLEVKQELEELGTESEDEGLFTSGGGLGDERIGMEVQRMTRRLRKVKREKDVKEKPEKIPKPKPPKERKPKAPKEKKKRGRKKQPRRLDGRDDITSEEEEDGEEVPVRSGSNYHVLFKRKVLKYANSHSNTATAEKFKLKPKLVREWKRNKEKIEKESQSPPKKRPRMDGYTVEEKLAAIAFAAERSTAEARLLYNVDSRTIGKWKAKKDRLEMRKNAGEGDAIRETGSGCKPKFTHIEGHLRDWVVGLRLKGNVVNLKMILAKANKLIEEHATDGHTTRGPRSSTWVVNFLNRHNLYHLIGTTLGHEDPREILADRQDVDVSSLASKIDEIPENPNKRHRRRITLQDKLNIIRRIEAGATQGTVAKSLSVATSTVQTIWSCRHAIIQKSLIPKKAKPKSSTLFWRKYSVIASALQDWYEQCLQSKTRVDAKNLTDKALQIGETYRLDDFRHEATEWLKLFCKRRDLKDVLAELCGTPSQGQQISLNSSTTTPHQHREPYPYQPQTQHPHHSVDAPYTPNSTAANVSESCDNDNSSNFHEAEAFNFAEYEFMNQNVQRGSNQVVEQSPSSTHHQNHANRFTFNHSLMSSSDTGPPVIVNSHLLTPVPLLEAMKCVGTLRSWIVGNYGPSNELNNHLTAIENAMIKKRDI